MSRPCQAEDSDGEECDCEMFAPKTGKPKVTIEETITSIILNAKAEHKSTGMLSKMTQAKRESQEGMQPSRPSSSRPSVRKDNQIEIALSATHEDVVDLLSQHLPGPMAYFDQIGRSVFGDAISGGMVRAAPWVLLTWVKTKLEIVHVANPTGQDLYTHRGPRNITENRYIFSAREAIPDEERLVWHTSDSLAFILPEESGESNDDIEGEVLPECWSMPKSADKHKVTPPKARDDKKGSTRKRISSIAFESSDGDSLSGIGVHNNYAEEDLPSIFTDAIAQELRILELVAMPLQDPRPLVQNVLAHQRSNLTRTPSPEVPFFMLARTPTPESEYATFDDPSFSDPVEYEYLTGPRTQRKYF
ncbi:hypothetical protein DFH09DRAFT_1100532 [Mycena vulgaris]|nr:hypothetical protein DFH09DRAFT_1100532 [Mycena vulgaris]